jgi:hypothetical protein
MMKLVVEVVVLQLSELMPVVVLLEMEVQEHQTILQEQQRLTLVEEVVELLLTLEDQVELAVVEQEEMILLQLVLLELPTLVVVEVEQEQMLTQYYQEQVVQVSWLRERQELQELYFLQVQDVLQIFR